MLQISSSFYYCMLLNFEKDLNQTTAEYSLGENGKIIVVNKGYNFKKNKYRQNLKYELNCL